MDASAKADIATWVIESGLGGTAEPDMLRGFCERVVAAGIPVIRAVVIVDTLHPVYEGRVFRWFRDPSDLAAMPSMAASARTTPLRSNGGRARSTIC